MIGVMTEFYLSVPIGWGREAFRIIRSWAGYANDMATRLEVKL